VDSGVRHCTNLRVLGESVSDGPWFPAAAGVRGNDVAVAPFGVGLSVTVIRGPTASSRGALLKVTPMGSALPAKLGSMLPGIVKSLALYRGH